MHLASSLTLYSEILQSVNLENPWTVTMYMLIAPREVYAYFKKVRYTLQKIKSYTKI